MAVILENRATDRVEYSRGVDEPRCPVVILCGGKGTRLREETEYKPKPMVEIGGKPILWHVMRSFAANGFREFVICLGYRGELIREYFLHYRTMSQDFTASLDMDPHIVHHGGPEPLDGCKVTLVETGQETATGGRVARAAPYLEGARFIVSYGDAVSNLDTRALLEFHRSHGKLGTVTAVRPTSRFGVLDLEGDTVVRFREKPRLDDWISAGYFVLEQPMLERIGGDDCALEREPLARLAGDGELRAFRHDGFWQPMDTYREYELLNDLWNRGDAPWLQPPLAQESRVS
jgi:glucose-1-phosphate cytidylyltransferase